MEKDEKLNGFKGLALHFFGTVSPGWWFGVKAPSGNPLIRMNG